MQHDKSFCRQKYGLKFRDLPLDQKREYLRIRKKQTRETNLETLQKEKEYSKIWYQKNVDSIREKQRIYYLNNKNKLNIYRKKYLEKKRGHAAGETSKIFIKYGKRYKDMTIEEKRQVWRDNMKISYRKRKERENESAS